MTQFHRVMGGKTTNSVRQPGAPGLASETWDSISSRPLNPPHPNQFLVHPRPLRYALSMNKAARLDFPIQLSFGHKDIRRIAAC
jgi:hypothetical protein